MEKAGNTSAIVDFVTRELLVLLWILKRFVGCMNKQEFVRGKDATNGIYTIKYILTQNAVVVEKIVVPFLTDQNLELFR